MTIYIKGNTKPIYLTQDDFLSEGGEGRVYVDNGKAFKIYFNKKDVIEEKKIQELSSLDKDNIVRPINLIYNGKNIPCGYVMDFVRNTVPLPKLFTTGFRNRNNIVPDMSIKLVEKILETIQFIHDNNILLIDGNEFNYLINEKDFITPYFIDVDSYQTNNYPAKVIMPSIKDWHTNGFSELSDWFSFAIVATQIFLGIHPYKGSHPDFMKGDLEARMKGNISIFNNKTSLPGATRSFDLIPSAMRNWLIDTFEKGKRIPPPQILGRVITKPQVIIISGLDKFDINELVEFDSRVTGSTFWMGNRVAYTEKDIFLDKKKIELKSPAEGVVFVDGNPIGVDIVNNELVLNIKGSSTQINTNIFATKKMVFNNRVYVLSGNKFIEIAVKEIGGKYFATTNNYWKIIPNSTIFLREMLVSNFLGKNHLFIPFEEKKCAIVKIDELDSYRILDGKYENRIVMILAYKKGRYDRLIFRLSNNLSKYTYEIEEDVTIYNINFTCLNNGIFVMMNGNDEVIVSSNKKMERKVVINAGIDGDAALFNDGSQVYFHLKNKIYKMKMK